MTVGSILIGFTDKCHDWGFEWREASELFISFFLGLYCRPFSGTALSLTCGCQSHVVLWSPHNSICIPESLLVRYINLSWNFLGEKKSKTIATDFILNHTCTVPLIVASIILTNPINVFPFYFRNP